MALGGNVRWRRRVGSLAAGGGDAMSAPIGIYRTELTRMCETLALTQLDAPPEFRRGYLTALAHLAHLCGLDVDTSTGRTFDLRSLLMEVGA